MPFEDSYIGQMRQLVGHAPCLVMPAMDIVIVNDAQEVLLIHNRDFDAWAFPGGYVEPEMTWPENAIREVSEETGLIANPAHLRAVGTISGASYQAHYPNGDRTQVFAMIYCLEDWQPSDHAIDTSEINQTKWVPLSDVPRYQLSFSGRETYRLYQRYRQFGQFVDWQPDPALNRFIQAQDGEVADVGTYQDAIREMTNGTKKSHWSWFVMPQPKGLSHSVHGRYYGLASWDEACAYYNDMILGPRLDDFVACLLTHAEKAITTLLAEDATKCHACMTLFAAIAGPSSDYQVALDVFFGGQRHAGVSEWISQERGHDGLFE